MRKLLFLTIAGLLNTTALLAQGGLEAIYVETYYISDEADSLDADENFAIYPLGIGSVTYRVYVDMLPGYKFIQLFGNQEHPLTIQTTTAFYNDPNYGVSVYSGTSLNNTKKNTTLIDTYLTVGGVANGLLGVPKEEDTDGSIGNLQGILANTNPFAGLPITGMDSADGLLPGTPVLPNTLGISSALDVFDQTEGGLFQTTNGTIAALGGATGATETNHVLIGQFTTDGILSFELNIQLLDENGDDEIYVFSNPSAGELTHPTLTFESEPIVSQIEVLNEKKIVIYPNPASEFIRLQLNDTHVNQIKILDATGRWIDTISNVQSTTLIDVRDYEQGIYFMEMSFGNQSQVVKFVKN